LKRKDVIRKLQEAGLTFREGGNHTIVLKDGRKVSVISRQREIAEPIVAAIEKQTGVKLR
jgi:predicted RNA binding protein YcfA (HicA-like mRNA interferase family)